VGPFSIADAPSAPTNLSVTSGTSSATLSWQEPSDTGGGDITGYVVEYREQNSLTWTEVNFTSTTAQITGLTTGQSYDFRVAGVNSGGEGPFSSTESVVIGPTVSAPPAVFAWKQSGQIHLGWDRVAMPAGVSFEYYQIERRLVDTDSWIPLGTDTDNRATFAGLPSGTYQLRVAAVANTGLGAFTISRQTVTF
jgi:predicted phage tail protein